MQNRRITKADFRPCSTCRSHSQALLCLYTLWLISDQPERTFARLRYRLGGDRPSQTPHLKLSPWVRIQTLSEWYLTVASTPPARNVSSAPTYPAQTKPEPNFKLE
jgi:hypothetical protein